MISNVQALKDKAKGFASKNNLQVQVVLQNFMFERFLARLAVSKYKDNFILKGGFLLSSIMGINIRTTMDIDANITGMDFDEEDTYKIVGILESNPDKNYVSNESPIGEALLGKKVGDIVNFTTPGGVAQMKVLKIF